MRQQSQRERIKRQCDALEQRYRQLMRGRMVPTPKALGIKAEITALKKEIQKIDRDAAERLALEKAPVDEVLEVVAIPLLADVLNDLVAGVNAMLRRNGVQETVFGLYTSQIQKAALAMVDTLEHSDAELPRLLDCDDTLVDAIKKKLMSFIRQRLNIKTER